MASNRMTEGVGKKIVDALKKQTDVEIMPQTRSEEYSQPEKNDEIPAYNNEELPPFDFLQDNNIQQSKVQENEPADDLIINPAKQVYTFGTVQEQKTAANNQPLFHESFNNDFEGFDLPQNVEVLRQLITKIPSNVSKQTGAQIIKQTMEALGISMKGVLQEAQAVQENLNSAARECQNNIAEYRRQIGVLESQTQKIHRQYSMLNDIISLFIQAGN